LYQRLPKRGFNNINAKRYAVINLGILQKFIDSGKLDIKNTLNEEALLNSGLVRRIWDGVRLLNKGQITSKVNIEVTGASKTAVAAIETVGGTVKVLKSVPAND
jgi:large subunit ribosomal protein L15